MDLLTSVKVIAISRQTTLPEMFDFFFFFHTKISFISLQFLYMVSLPPPPLYTKLYTNFKIGFHIILNMYTWGTECYHILKITAAGSERKLQPRAFMGKEYI